MGFLRWICETYILPKLQRQESEKEVGQSVLARFQDALPSRKWRVCRRE
jgi:hypothetical protein